jgi:hypothetical protein
MPIESGRKENNQRKITNNSKGLKNKLSIAAGQKAKNKGGSMLKNHTKSTKDALKNSKVVAK